MNEKAGKKKGPYFCVATTTYNMAGTLYRTYESVLAQTYKNFFWLVIDNGSEDDTEIVIRKCMDENKIKIKYVRIKHGIRMVGMNAMLDNLAGDLCVEVHADDTLTTDALEIFAREWQAIPKKARKGIWTMVSYCIDCRNGEIVGKRFPRNINRHSAFAWRYQFHTIGEKHYAMNIAIVRTKRVNVEEFKDVSYIAESVLWEAFMREYQMWYVDQATRVYYDDNPNRATEKKASKSTRNAYYLSHLYLLNTLFRFDKKPLRDYLMHAAICFQNGSESGRNLATIFFALHSTTSRFLLLCSWPFIKMYHLIRRG